MKKKITIFWMFLFLCLVAGCNQIATTTDFTTGTTVTTATTTFEPVEEDQVFADLESFSLTDLLSDFDYVVSKYENQSPKLFTDVDSTDLIINEQREKLEEGMNEFEFLRVLAPIIASINCAHSGIYLSDSTYDNVRDNGKFIALDMRIIDDEIIVIDNSLESEVRVGSKIVSINGFSSSDIITILKDCTPSDGQNQTTKYGRINENFRASFYMYIDATDSHILEYIEPDSDLIHTIRSEAKTSDEINSLYSNNDWFPYTAEYHGTYAILDMNSFQPFGEQTIASYQNFIENFFQTVETEGIQNVILDVRDNGGGDPMVTSFLFNYLAKEEQPYFSSTVPSYYSGLQSNVPFNEPHFDGNLFTIMNGLSGSSTGHLLALLKFQDIGVFVGEESGASNVVTDSTVGYTLWNTKLNYRLSQQIWDVAVSGLTEGRGIMPDYEYKLTLSDYLSNEDELLLYTIGLIDNLQ